MEMSNVDFKMKKTGHQETQRANKQTRYYVCDTNLQFPEHKTRARKKKLNKNLCVREREREKRNHEKRINILGANIAR